MIIEGVPGSTARDQSRAKTDVLKEMKHYGLHRHFTGASSILMFGGGVKKGLDIQLDLVASTLEPEAHGP